MIEIAKNADGVCFYLLEHPFELDKLGIGEFSYFKKHLGMSDYKANFKSWLKRPTVYLVVAVKGNLIIGWSMNEKWSKASLDGRPVFVLRAIEISPDLSSKGLGRALFILISKILPGHIITKPVNANAKKFFSSLSFIQPERNCAVDLADYPGYMVLNENTKILLTMDRMGIVQDSTEQCKTKVFPNEKAPVTKEQKAPAISEPVKDVRQTTSANDTHIATDVIPSTDATVCGEFTGKQKMLSACECGENLAGKYLQKGKRSGTAFICCACGKERYFLPLRKIP